MEKHKPGQVPDSESKENDSTFASLLKRSVKGDVQANETLGEFSGLLKDILELHERDPGAISKLLNSRKPR